MGPDQFRALHGLPPRDAAKVTATLKEGKPQIRVPKKRGPNKTERAWMDRLLRNREEIHHVLFEPFTLHLPSGTRYTPDVVVLTKGSGLVVAIWEVKGKHIHNQRSIHAWKEARAAFPFWSFGFAQLRGTEWHTTIE
jgi:hypothetical protein